MTFFNTSNVYVLVEPFEGAEEFNINFTIQYFKKYPGFLQDLERKEALEKS